MALTAAATATRQRFLKTIACFSAAESGARRTARNMAARVVV